jgi:hypothetical protein
MDWFAVAQNRDRWRVLVHGISEVVIALLEVQLLYGLIFWYFEVLAVY